MPAAYTGLLPLPPIRGGPETSGLLCNSGGRWYRLVKESGNIVQIGRKSGEAVHPGTTVSFVLHADGSAMHYRSIMGGLNSHDL
jgi:hypothetical protein